MAMRLIYAVLAVLAAAGRTTENDRRTIEGDLDVPIAKGPAPVDVEGGEGASTADDEADDDDDPELKELLASLPALPGVSRRTSEMKCIEAEEFPKGPDHTNMCFRLFWLSCCCSLCSKSGGNEEDGGEEMKAVCCCCNLCTIVVNLYILYFVFLQERNDYGGCTLFNVWWQDNDIGLYEMGIWCGFLVVNGLCSAFCCACAWSMIGFVIVMSVLGKASEGSFAYSAKKHVMVQPRGLVRMATRGGTGTGTGAANNEEANNVGNANQV